MGPLAGWWGDLVVVGLWDVPAARPQMSRCSLALKMGTGMGCRGGYGDGMD